MTAHDALGEGRLADALAIQRDVVAKAKGDTSSLRLLIDLLAFAGQFEEALNLLEGIDSSEPEWLGIRKFLREIFRLDCLRSRDRFKPHFQPNPPPRHASHRLRGVEAIRAGRPSDAVRCIDAADDAAPEIRGFLDGQEFEGLRDADDRFASVLEALHEGNYVWFAWEAVRKVRLKPAAVLIDQLYRPAEITLKAGATLFVHLPLVYPGSHRFDEAFALGLETDRICPDGGPTRCIGAKSLMVGDDAEVPLGDCQMIEVR